MIEHILAILPLNGVDVRLFNPQSKGYLHDVFGVYQVRDIVL